MSDPFSIAAIASDCSASYFSSSKPYKNRNSDSDSDAVLDVTIDDYKPLYLDFSGRLLESATDGTLTVVLFAPETSEGSPKIARLTVLGNVDSQLIKGYKL